MSDTQNELNKLINSPLTMGIALIVIGILFCALRSGFVSILMTIAGVFLIVFGVLNLVGRRYTNAAIQIAVGAVIIICGWTIVDFTLLILGIILLAYAIYQMFTSIPLLKKSKPIEIIMTLLYPVLMLAVGVILIVAKWQMIDAIFIVIGAIAIASGILAIAKNLFGSKKQITGSSGTNR